MTNIPFFWEPVHPKILLQITFNHTNDKVVEYKIEKNFNKKSGRYLIK